MLLIEISLVICTLFFVFLGGWSIFWARCSASGVRAAWGRRLFVAAFVGLGVAGLVAARTHANGLAPLGLLAGLLLVGMVWETPTAATPRTSRS